MLINNAKVTELMIQYGLKTVDELLLIKCVFERDYNSLHKLAICKGKEASFTHDVIIGLIDKNIFQNNITIKRVIKPGQYNYRFHDAPLFLQI